MSVYRRALERAVHLKGARRLAQILAVSLEQVESWMSAAAPIPGWAAERIVDVVLEADVSTLRAQRVMVVDDDPAGAYGLARLLKIMGYPVETALNWEEAVATARRFEPHVVFIDLRMPDMDGCDLAVLLRAEPYSPRIIAATAYGDPEDRQRTAAAGFEAHLVKPIDVSMLEPYLPRMT
ncbi:MAG TPA: response regulator [Burkholderiales bacterium]|nr:response regulator [Burkholderiales bacterium]